MVLICRRGCPHHTVPYDGELHDAARAVWPKVIVCDPPPEWNHISGPQDVAGK